MKITGNKLIDNGDSITVIRESYRILGTFLGAALGMGIVLYTPLTDLIISTSFAFGESEPDLMAINVDLYLVAITTFLGMLLAQGHRERDVLKSRVVTITRRYGEVTVIVAAQDPFHLPTV